MACSEKCNTCGPQLSIFSILVTANLPVNGFWGFGGGTMPYKKTSYKDKGNSSNNDDIQMVLKCDRNCMASCPPAGGWNSCGTAAGQRVQTYSAQARSSSSIKPSISEKGNYRLEERVTASRSSRGSGSANGTSFSWQKSTHLRNLFINGALDPSSRTECFPVVVVPNTFCGYDPQTCERVCADNPYNNGGCSQSISDIPWLPAPDWVSEEEVRIREEVYSTNNEGCGGEVKGTRFGSLYAVETVAERVKESDILGMAKQAAKQKIILKKENQDTWDENINITEDGSCCLFAGTCDGYEGPVPVEYIDSCDSEGDDDCSITSITQLPSRCGCSNDRDECWDGYSNIGTPAAFSYTNVTIGAFRIASNVNQEEFSKEYEYVSGKVYFYIDSESEPNTSPCCTDCGGPECFTGQIVGESSYTLSAGGKQFKQNTRITTDLNYTYDSADVYELYPDQVIKVCYTIDSVAYPDSN